MEEITLTRVCSSNKGTFGVLSWDEMPICVTCELPWKGNQPRKSCIPVGRYECRPYSSAKFKDAWELQSVPKRSAILIHVGNTIADIEGCILVGKSFGTLNELPSVTSSAITMRFLKRGLPANFNLLICEAYQ